MKWVLVAMENVTKKSSKKKSDCSINIDPFYFLINLQNIKSEIS